MKKLCLLILLSFSLFLNDNIHAQFLKNLQKSLQDKVEKKLEQKLTDALTDALSKKLEEKMDTLLKEEYKKSNGLDPDEKVDWPNNQDAFSAFLKKMNTAAKDLPPSYTFDLQMVVESSFKNKKPQRTTRLFTSSGNAFGIQTNKEEDNTLIIIDIEKDIIVMYTTKKDGSKTAQALPSLLHVSASLAKNNTSENPPKITKTGKSKSIAGYTTQEYLVEQDKSTSHVWIAENFPYQWKDAYSGLLKKFTPDHSESFRKESKGMPMEITTYTPDDTNNPTQHTTTISVSKSPLTIINKEYTFVGRNE